MDAAQSAVLSALVLYFSPGGNTRQGGRGRGAGTGEPRRRRALAELSDGKELALEDYDLVCLGAPSYHFDVPAPVKRWAEEQVRAGNRDGLVRLGAPARPGKWAAVFITYGGPHTGLAEATPAGDHLAQLCVHLGRQVRAVWYTLGEFHGDRDQPNNQYGLLGDIRGRPDEHDLAVAARNAAGLAHGLQHEKALLNTAREGA